MSVDSTSVKFVPFSSSIDNGFWYKLTKNKLEKYCLDDTAIAVLGYYSNNTAIGLPCFLNVDFNAFEKEITVHVNETVVQGRLINTNTLEDFKNFNKTELLDDCSHKLMDTVVSGEALEFPNLLTTFYLLSFSDLKKYNYYYWFCYPTLYYPEDPFEMVDQALSLTDLWTEEQLSRFFGVYKGKDHELKSCFLLAESCNGQFSLHKLKEYSTVLNTAKTVLLTFSDPSTTDLVPGWPLRNLLVLASYHYYQHSKELKVLCLRDRTKEGIRSIDHSVLLNVRLKDLSTKSKPQCVGWEKNERSKMGPRLVNLGSSMDPLRLAESSVDLNLQLMRWRMVPSLDLTTIRDSKCLLLGAGTLGCNVARCLLGWGVRHITFVDNGKVSFSNPVRQSLFSYVDCLNGGAPKAQAAAEAIKKICPHLNCTGVSLSIAMPGHTVVNTDEVKAETEKLDQLINEHDCVFLLTDTRESRWLPTLIAKSKLKIVITAALGFDSYLVMRHGLNQTEVSDVVPDATGDTSHDIPVNVKFIPGGQLGCYFCNDVVAPANSTNDRTLDQQCTVTRPGISMLAASYATELFISILQHKERGMCGAYASERTQEQLSVDPPSLLGVIPHQIRGYLSWFHTILPATIAFNKCTACSPMVLEEYKKNGFWFLLKAFNNPSFLEDLTGLTKLHNDTNLAEVWELSDDD